MCTMYKDNSVEITRALSELLQVLIESILYLRPTSIVLKDV